jgi:hypothetical protein
VRARNLAPLDARTFGKNGVERMRNDIDERIARAWKTGSNPLTVTTVLGHFF